MTFVRISNQAPVAPDQALVELSKAAREVLETVGSTYRGSITYRQLAVEAQKIAGIRAGRTAGWMASVVTMVARVNSTLSSPPTTSLVVNEEDGHVGVLFDEVLRLREQPLPANEDEREARAAEARLECYRKLAAFVPENAVPATVEPGAGRRTTRVRTPASRAPKPTFKPLDPSKPRRAEDFDRAPHVVCHSCWLQTPPGAVCANCGEPL